MAARLTAYVVVAIVSATLIAGLMVGAQRDDNDGPVDLIVQNAVVYTADAGATTAEAVAVRGNRILRVGSNREIARLQRRQTVVVDARGGTVLPGFNDANLQFGRGPVAFASIDLTGVSTVGEVLARVGAWSIAHPGTTWIVGRGWSPERFRSGTPWRQVLDSVVPNRPVMLFGMDESSAWVNSIALRLADIGRGTLNPPDGLIARDLRTGEPSGLLSGAAAELVARHIPAPAADERTEALRAAIADANAVGITSVQNADESLESLEIYSTLRDSGELTLRLYAAIPLHQPVTQDELERLEATKTRYADDPLFKAGALTIRLDGAAWTRSTALLQPHQGPADPEAPAGWTSFEPDDLNRTVRLADAAGWQIITHARGDAAVRMALDAYAHAARSNRLPARGRRHRIEGLALIDAADVPRLGALGVIASMQPASASPTPPRTELFTRHPGTGQAPLSFPFLSVAEQTSLVFGSGWPASDPNPLLGLHAAVTAPVPAGRAAASWVPQQRLTLGQAIDAYTSAPAWASFDEQRKGSISPGMLADMVVLSQDIFARPADELASTSVVTTIFDGRIVYERQRRPDTE